MVDFVSEVQEELRKDDYNKWLKQYGPYLLGIIVAIILATAYMEWNKSKADKSARATSAAFIDASKTAEEGDLDGAIQKFVAISEAAPEGYAGLSLMRAAGLMLEQGNATEAVRLLDTAAADFTLPRHSHLAQIKAAYILADQGNYNDVKLRVGALAEKDAPYEYLARELLGFAAKQTDDIQTARQQFSYLETIPGVPESIQGRAKQYLSLMRVSDDAAADAPVPTDETTSIDETTPTDQSTDVSSEEMTNDE